jgi:hypothetical protein
MHNGHASTTALDDHALVRLNDDRYLFHLKPWVFFPLWFAVGAALGWLLEDAPLWLRLLIGIPVGWAMPAYIIWLIIRSPRGERFAERRGRTAPPAEEAGSDER